MWWSLKIIFLMFPADEDYGRVDNKMLVFLNSSGNGTELCYNISINNDFTLESNETSLVMLSSADVGVVLQNNISVVTIIDGGECKFHWIMMFPWIP